MKVTINDVAKQAGVSIKTVSRVMNNEPSVRKDTFDKVMAAINELHYQPNAAARNLASTRSYSIGYIYDNPNAYYIIDMQKGLLDSCKKHGYELLIHPTNAKSPGIVDEVKELVTKSRLAGLILTPPFSEMPHIAEALEDMKVDFVRIVSGSTPSPGVHNCVLIDDFTAAFKITNHLLELGHTDIAFLCGDEEHSSSGERLAGFKAALTKRGLTVNPKYIVPGHYSFESGVEGAKKLMALPKRPSAVFACNDEIAAGALFSARLMNIRIPDELSIAGFENSPFSRQTWPPLTTAHQPNSTIASQAAELLFKHTRPNANKAQIQAQPVFIPELLVRESTSPLDGEKSSNQSAKP
ncbi:LacI family DNA-binding transcriptional regulator [Alkalimonas delamerensis]|uniref:LacI family DNA-binding transcriptional regulator n=1 Tax=Alkalimonas delamerensis TaxID=265981 RepID=A0ABT9GKM3_9GAMM|nr:LacI family DNA-binding transcriptional regulator [Alkalimonas delamerensis]MDP4527522.1 LacI family DNA-binding transcriptional regulator [Alkalimonas delamerensis]